MIGDLNRCTAYLELSESIEPHSSNVSRKISSSDFIPALVSTSDSNLFVLPNESIVFTQNEKNVSIDVEYSFKNTNYSIKQQTWAKIGTLTSEDEILRCTSSQTRLKFLDSSGTISNIS